MIVRERAEIIAIDDDLLTVSTALKQGCSGCAQQQSCGAGIISKAFSDRRQQFQLRRPLHGQWQIGDQVELQLPQQLLTKLSLLLYGLPLLVLLTSALLTQLLLVWPEWAVIVSSGCSMAACFVLLKQALSRHDVKVQALLKIQQSS